MVYAADLSGTVHAIDLKTGTAKWTLTLAKEGGAPGMVYGGVTVHGGKLVVATCNLEGPYRRQGNRHRRASERSEKPLCVSPRRTAERTDFRSHNETTRVRARHTSLFVQTAPAQEKKDKPGGRDRGHDTPRGDRGREGRTA